MYVCACACACVCVHGARVCVCVCGGGTASPPFRKVAPSLCSIGALPLGRFTNGWWQAGVREVAWHGGIAPASLPTQCGSTDLALLRGERCPPSLLLQCPHEPRGYRLLQAAMCFGNWVPRVGLTGGPSPGSPFHTLFDWVMVSGQGSHGLLLWLWPFSVSPGMSCGFLSCGAYQLESEQESPLPGAPLHPRPAEATGTWGPGSWAPCLLAPT